MGFFYPEWKKITRIGVTNPPTTTGYQVKVEIPWQPGMSDDFSDLRFSDYYRTLPYWIETSTSRSTATVWVKLTEINEAAKDIFCYYGNGGASSESSGDNTFELFDHFDAGASPDTSKWYVDGSPTVSGSILTVNTGLYGVFSKTNFSTGYSMVVRGAWNQGGDASNNYPIIGFTSLTTGIDLSGNDELMVQSVKTSEGGGYIQSRKTGTWGTQYGFGSSYTGYRVWTMSRLSTTQVAILVNTTTLQNPRTTQIPTASLYIRLGMAHTPTTPMTIDWVFVRKCATTTATEPTCTPAESGINSAWYQAILRAKHIVQDSYPYTLAVSFITDHMHLTWTEP